MSGPALHHVAYACRDLEATVHFYEDLLGFPLVNTEVTAAPGGAYLRHVFFDTGDGSCVAFFDLHGVGEQPDWRSDLSSSVGLPVWVNHIAFRATAEQQDAVRQRMAEVGVAPLMELDHHWCVSLYFVDPNGIMVELCRDTAGMPIDRDEAHRLLHDSTGNRPPARPVTAPA